MKKQILLSITLLAAGNMLAMNDNNTQAPRSPRTQHLCETFFTQEHSEAWDPTVEGQTQLKALLPKLPTEEEQVEKQLTLLIKQSLSGSIDAAQLTAQTNMQVLKQSIKGNELLLIEYLAENDDRKTSLFNKVIQQQRINLNEKIKILEEGNTQNKKNLVAAYKTTQNPSQHDTSPYTIAQKQFIENLEKQQALKKQLNDLKSLAK